MVKRYRSRKWPEILRWSARDREVDGEFISVTSWVRSDSPSSRCSADVCRNSQISGTIFWYSSESIQLSLVSVATSWTRQAVTKCSEAGPFETRWERR